MQSKPNRQLGVSVAKQAEYDAMAEHIAWSNSRVAAFSQYLLKDDPTGGAPGASVHGGSVGFQTGLEYVSGARKPLYFGWPVPLTVSKHGHSFSLWGLVRPATGATKVTVLVRAKGSKKYRTLKTVDDRRHAATGHSAPPHAGSTGACAGSAPHGVKYEGPPIEAH